MTARRSRSSPFHRRFWLACSRPRSGDWWRASSWCLALIYVLDPKHAFFQAYSLQTLLHRVALFGVLAVGAAVVIIAGGIDLSTGAVVALSSVVSAKLLTEWLRRGGADAAPPSFALVMVAIAITLLLGLLIGLFHALMINELRLPPFIATLATMAGLRSLATLVCQNKTINVSFDSYRVWGSYSWYTLAIFSVCRRVHEHPDGMDRAGTPPLRPRG